MVQEYKQQVKNAFQKNSVAIGGMITSGIISDTFAPTKTSIFTVPFLASMSGYFLKNHDKQIEQKGL